MYRKSLLAAAILSVAILIGCGTHETTNSNTASDNSNKTATTSTTNSSGPSTTAPAGDKIGVPECDDYIAKYEACVRGKVPEQARAALESSLKAARENWKTAAANPQTKGTLAAACKQANDAAAASMKAYGCSF